MDDGVRDVDVDVEWVGGCGWWAGDRAGTECGVGSGVGSAGRDAVTSRY